MKMFRRRGIQYGYQIQWILLLTSSCVYFLACILIQPATAQDQNAPPILYVRERNWRISEMEQIGQVIDRVRAEDPDGDDLTFGLEQRFLSIEGGPSDNLPFHIDPSTGVVYLSESLKGRAGESFLIYVTVSDGQYTAKNEVFINILGQHKVNMSQDLPSISNVVKNISHFLPSFDKLPGVQSIRSQLPHKRPTNKTRSFFLENEYLQSTSLLPPLYKQSTQHLHDDEESVSLETTTKSYVFTISKSRTKLTPINLNTTANITLSSVQEESAIQDDVQLNFGNDETNSLTELSFKSLLIPTIVAVCTLFGVATIFVGLLYRKRICAFGKTIKKKSNDDIVTKIHQVNPNSTLTSERFNSMALQQWRGPTAYGNRYVPWERDQQSILVTTSQLLTSNGSGDASIIGVEDNYGVTRNLDKYDRWEFPRHRLKFFNILGEGAFGQVWRCEASDIDGVLGVTTVAVKTLKESAADLDKKDLLSELEVMKSLEPHVNVVRLIGCCTDKDPTFVIIEYVNRGKLQTYLRNSRAERNYGNTHGKSNILTSGDLTSFMYQVAKGMDYLTSRGIIHRDLAARNILITDDHTCKVADFGFARDIVTSKIYERKSEGKLPIRWMAIESLYDNIFSDKSDIWSFGILMWEIVTLASTPYPGISAADVMRKVRDGYRLEKPEHCRRELYNIMYYCWSQDPSERPTFREVVQMLDKLLHTEMDYIELECFPDHSYYNIISQSGEKL